MAVAQDRPVEARALLNRYCVTCHNEKLRTAGLTLDTIDVTKVSERADVWEKAVRKLRAGLMPPAGRPRPDKTTYDGLAAWLETELDRAAAANSNPGRTEAVHRLNRTEYRNVIRDLLALDVEVVELLPADDTSYGFDTIAGALAVSPTLLERYMSAARKISRSAVGAPVPSPTAETFRVQSDLPQDDRLEGLPFGTRGGTLIRYHFPEDAEYLITIEPEGRPTEPHEIEVTVDGERVQLFTVKPRPGGMGQAQQDAYEARDAGLEVRLPVKAGPRKIGVAFIEKTDAEVEALRQPFLRPYGGQVAQPRLDSVTITGPFEASGARPSEETPSRRRIFVCRPADSGERSGAGQPSGAALSRRERDRRSAASGGGAPRARSNEGPLRIKEEAACVKQILSTLARRAYRRPVTDADLQGLLPFYEEGRAKAGFEAGIETALRRLLVSPEFLFRIERDPQRLPPNTNYRISDLELASRLSFFLWSSIPDDELLDVASRGDLKQPAVLEQQVRRMLADTRAQALVSGFAAQWLVLRRVEAWLADQYLFPDFEESLRQALPRETELFFESIMREDRSVLDMLTANYTFVNERLARHYGIPNVYGSHFRRITLGDDNPRRGLLGHASVLTLTSYPARTSPVVRGKWILENILGTPPPPPPPDVSAALPENPSGKVLSMRDRMAAHRANPVCATCHSMMDPLGLSLENFDAVGRWRDRMEGNTAIDVSGVFPDGTKFEGVSGLRDVLLSRPEQFVTNVTEKMLTYALGRGLEYYDAPSVRTIRRDAARRNYSFSSLILGIVNSAPFQMRRAAPAQGTVGGQ
jgi:hypothetical protein